MTLDLGQPDSSDEGKPQRSQSTRFLVWAGILSSIGAGSSPTVLGNNTDPRPSFVQAVLLATVGILALAVAFARCTPGARVVAAIFFIVDVVLICKFADSLDWLFELQ